MDTNSATSTSAPPLPREHRVIRDTFNGRPVLRVVGLPVFAEHVRKFGAEVVKVDGQSLDDLTRWLNARESEGWNPAIHEEHNGPMAGARPRLAFASRARVGYATLEGSPRAVLYVDAIVEDESALEQLERHCFRSPEINIAKRTMESIAAMQSEGPWFKFPIARFNRDPGATLEEQEASVGYAAGGECVLAYSLSHADGLYRALYQFPKASYVHAYAAQGDVMDDAKKPEAMALDDEKYADGEEEGDAMEELCSKLLAMIKPGIAQMIRDAQASKPAASPEPVVMSRADTETVTGNDSTTENPVDFGIIQ